MNNWDGNTNIPAEKIDTSMHFGMKREVSKIMKSSKNDRNNNVMKIKPMFNTVMLSFTTATFVQTLPSYVPANSLAGHWPFSGNANDESGNNKNGKVNGATLTKDQFINL
jgi:hypothetical protein